MMYIIIWYLIGLFGSLYFMKKEFREVTVKDLIACILIAGPLGIISVLMSFAMSDFGNKKIF